MTTPAPARPAEQNGATPEQATMQAIVQSTYGTEPESLLRLTRIPVPAPARDEVLVRVHAASVDRGTWHLMAGKPYLMRGLGFGVRGPRTAVPGLAMAGVVAAVGADVTDLHPGDAVYGTAKGSLAEYATARADRLAPKPANLTFEQAAAVPVSGPAALQAVRDQARVQAGQRVLVIGASGGVGTFAVQIAAALGAEVTAVCSTSKTDLVRALGATHVIDYTQQDITDGQLQYDVIVDIAGNRSLSNLRRALTASGTLVITGGEDGGSFLGGIGRNLRAALVSPFVRQRLVAFVARQRQADLAALTQMLEAGSIAPAVDETFPLADAAAAIRRVTDGKARGKVVVSV